MADSNKGKAFSEFILRNYPPERYGRVLMPAEGNYTTAVHLAGKYKEIIVVDPFIRAVEPKGVKTAHKMFWYKSAIEADLIVGMHPDSATGEIVSYARIHKIPLAIVPCCALGRFAPPSIDYEGWMRLLSGKIEDFAELRQTRLPMTGRNICLFTI